MSHDEQKTINPLMAVLVGAAVGAAATYLMRKEDREKVVKKYNTLKTKASNIMNDTQKKVESTKKDLTNWAQEMGDKAEEEAQKIESQAKKRKLLA